MPLVVVDGLRGGLQLRVWPERMSGVRIHLAEAVQIERGYLDPITVSFSSTCDSRRATAVTQILEVRYRAQIRLGSGADELSARKPRPQLVKPSGGS